MNITADEFNARHPVGTLVTYYHVFPEVEADGLLPMITHTRTPAWELGDGSQVVSVQGRSGGTCLTHIELRGLPAPAGLHSGEGLMATLDSMTAEREEAESIRCPHCQHCQHAQDLDELAEYDQLVTLWGDNNGPAVTEVECGSCEKAFQVRENVTRTFDVAKMDEELE